MTTQELETRVRELEAALRSYEREHASEYDGSRLVCQCAYCKTARALLTPAAPARCVWRLCQHCGQYSTACGNHPAWASDDTKTCACGKPIELAGSESHG